MGWICMKEMNHEGILLKLGSNQAKISEQSPDLEELVMRLIAARCMPQARFNSLSERWNYLISI